MPKLPNLLKKTLSVKEASAFLKVSSKTLRRWTKASVLSSIRTAGGHRRFFLNDLQKLKMISSKRRITLWSLGSVKKSQPKVKTVEPTQNTESIGIFKALKDSSNRIADHGANSPSLFHHFPKKTITPERLLKISLVLSILIAVLLVGRIAPSNWGNIIGQRALKLLPGYRDLDTEQSISQETLARVLAESTSIEDISFKVNVDTILRRNVTAEQDLEVQGNLNLTGNSITSADDLTITPGGSNVKVGSNLILSDTSTLQIGGRTGTPYSSVANPADTPDDTAISADNDLFIGGDLEVNGLVNVATLVIGGDSLTDLVGSGLQVSSGTLQTTLGTSIDSAEIVDDTIKEIDLTVSNSPVSGYALSYDSSTGGFTWSSIAGSLIWTDSGTTTYLTDTTDELVVGGTTPLSSAKVSVDGDSDQIQFLVQGNSTQTSNLVVFENSGGTDLFSVDGSGNLTLAGNLDVNGTTNDIAGTLNLSGNNLSSSSDLNIDAGGGNVIFANNDTFQIGGTTALTYNAIANNLETASDARISSDNDLYIGGDLEVSGDIVGLITCVDCIDWSDILDAMTLDDATTSTHTSSSNVNSWTWSLVNNGGGAGTDQLFVISNALSSNASGDLNTEALLLLDQADTTGTGNTAVDSALLVTNSGGSTLTNAITIGSGSQAITTALNIASTGVTTDISLQNGETIDNNTNGTILLTATTTQASGGLTVAGSAGISLTDTSADLTFGNGESINNDTDGRITVAGADLALSSATGDLIFGNGETINNDTNGTLLLTATTTSLSGNLVVQGGDITLDTSGTIIPSAAGTITIGDANLQSLTVITDGSGDAEVSLPTGAISGTEILDDTVTASDLAATLTFADGDFVDFGGVNPSSTTEGLKLPQNATACSLATADGQICWDNSADTLYVGNGAAAQAMSNPFGASIDSSEITDDTINWIDIADTMTLDDPTTATHTTTTNANSWTWSLVNNGGTAGTDQLFVISNALSSNASGDLNTEALLLLDQADTTGTGNTAVDSALLVTNSGGSTLTNAITIGSGSQAITTALNIASTGVTTDISLQNGETIDNNTDGVITLGADISVTGGDITGANGESIDIGEADNGSIVFTGSGETNNGSVTFDLETNTIPTLTSSTDTAIGIDEDLTFIGAQSIDTTTGNLTIQPAGSATTAVVQIGAGGAGSSTPDFLGLDVKSDTGDPVGGAEGYIYYNNFTNRFRCYQDTGWTDCVAAGTSPFTSVGGIIDKGTASDRLRLLYGDAADTQLEIDSSTNQVVPSADAVVIDLTSGATNTGIVTDGVDALYIALEAGNIAADGTISAIRVNFDPITGGGAGDIFYGLNIEGVTATGASETAINIDAGWDIDIDLQNAATISNAVDSNIAFAENSRTLNLDFAEVASRIKLESASEIEIESTSNTTSAIVLDSTVGGIDITASAASAGEDIDIAATGSSVNITATEGAADNIVLTSTNGGIDITATGAAAGEDIDVTTDASINLTSTEGVADGLVLTSTNGGIDITTTGSVAGEDIDITAGGSSINLSSSEAVSDAIKLVASDAAGQIFVDAGTTDKIADAVRFDVDVNSANVDAVYIDLDVGTALSAAEQISGVNIDVTGLAGDDSTSLLYAVNLNGNIASAGTVKAINLSGSFDTGIDFDPADVTTEIVLENGESISNQTDNQINLNLGTSGTLLLTSGTTASLTNSSGALTVQSASASNLNLLAGTSAQVQVVQIGAGGAGSSTPDFLGLDVKSDTGDPVGGAEGYIYYNNFTNRFRCYQDTGWTDCVGTGSTPTFDDIYQNSITASNLVMEIDDTGGLTFNMTTTGDFILQDNGANLASFGNDSIIALTPANATTAGGRVEINGISTISTATDGLLDINAASITDSFEALNLSLLVGNDVGVDTMAGGYIVVDNDATSVDDNVYALQIENSASSTANLDAGLYINNLDTIQTINDAILIASTGGGAITTALNINDPDVVTDIALQNGETISNDTDGTILLTATTTSLSGDLAVSGGDITGANGESIDIGEADNGSIVFTGSGETNNGSVTFDLETNTIPTLTSSTDTAIGIDEDLTFIGAQSIDTTTGNLTIQPAGSATTAVVQIGAGGAGSSTPDFLGLDVKSDTGDPVGGAEGYIYYNNFTNRFRCYQDTGWTDCVGTGSTPTFDDIYQNSITASNLVMEIDDTGGLTFNMTTTGDFILQDNGANLASFGNDSIIALTPANATTAGGKVLIDGASTASTTTDGLLDINAATITDSFEALNLALTVNNDAGVDTIVGGYISVDNDATTADDNVYALQIENSSSSTANLDAGLYINNLDTAQTINDAILIASTGGGAITTALNINDTDVVTDIKLQNGETIDNNTDGTILLTATTTQASGGLTVGGSAGINLSDITADITFGNGESINNDTNGTLLLTATTTQASGGLTVGGSAGINLSDITADITFGNGESINNDTDGTLQLVATTASLSGTTTLTASSLATFTTAATLGMASTTTLNCGDCIDFDDMVDAMTLDAATTITRSSSGNESSLSLSLVNSGGADGTDRLFVVSNGASTNASGDLTTEAILVLDQADTTVFGDTTVDSALLIAKSGTSTLTNAISIGTSTETIATALNIASTGVATDIRLQNAETIDNNTDGTVLVADGDTTTLLSASKTAFSLNLDDTTTRTERLCHGGGDAGTGVAAISDCNSSPGDYAEYYGTEDPSLDAGDLVVADPQRPSIKIIKEGAQISKAWVFKSNSRYQTSLIGVVSTNPNEIIGNVFEPEENPRPIALNGRVPVKVSSENGEIKIGDPLTSSSIAGVAMKATAPGPIVGKALENYNSPDPNSIGLITTFITTSWFEPQLALNELGTLQITVDQNPQSENGKYTVVDESGKGIDISSAFTNIVVGNIKGGLIESKELATETISALTLNVDNLFVKLGLEAPFVKTEMISPIAQSNLVINLENTEPGSATTYGKLSVTGEGGAEVASIDALGNTQLAGDATVAGELRANKIYADEIVSKTGNFANLSESAISGIAREEIEKMLAEAQIDQSLLSSSGSWEVDTTSGSANLKDITTQNLYVTDQIAANSLSVSSAITLGSDLIIQSTLGSYGLKVNSIDTLSSPLKIQSLALAPIEFMDGKVRIDTNGSVTIESDLFVQGKVKSSSLSSGSVEFSDVSTNKVAVTTDIPTGSFDAAGNYIIESLASVGKGKVPAGESEVTIKNINTKVNVLIYVTPTTSTGNNVLYVKSQNGCEGVTGTCEPSFIVGFDGEVSQDVEFNWWIVGTQQASVQ